MKQTTVQIVEDYLAQRTLGQLIPKEELTRRFRKAGISEEFHHEVFTELDYEWELEREALFNEAKSKKRIVAGLVLTIGSLTVSILSALKLFFFENLFIFVYGGIGAGILAALSGYSTLKKGKRRRERRRVKWSVWDKPS